MKSILLIGLGRFGRHIAIKLDELHHQVMAVDKEDTRVDAVLPFVTNAQIGDATNEDFFEFAWCWGSSRTVSATSNALGF